MGINAEAVSTGAPSASIQPCAVSHNIVDSSSVTAVTNKGVKMSLENARENRPSLLVRVVANTSPVLPFSFIVLSVMMVLDITPFTTRPSMCVRLSSPLPHAINTNVAKPKNNIFVSFDGCQCCIKIFILFSLLVVIHSE